MLAPSARASPAEAVDRRGVEERVVEGLDPGGVGAGLGLRFLEIGEQRLEVAVGLLAGDPEPADVRTVGRDLGRVHPSAVGVGVEVVAGLHRGVHRRLVDAELGAGLDLGGLAVGLLAGDGTERGGGDAEQQRGNEA